MTKLVAAVSLLIVISTPAAYVTSSILSEMDDGHERMADSMVLTPHEPINVDGNLGFTNASGVVWGSGTEADPYMISGWDINASTARGIFILNASAHFIIEGCYVHGGALNDHNGIQLDESSNGTIRNSESSGNRYGILLSNASCDNSVINNTCSENQYDGIELYSKCDRNIIDDNTFVGNLDGIHLESSRHNIVSDNIMVLNGVTMIGYDALDCTTNFLSNNSVNGKPVCFYRNQSGAVVPQGAGEVILVNCTDFLVANQTLDYAHVGIEVLFSSRISIVNNTCTNNSYGILLWTSANSTITGNTIRNNDVTPEDWWYGIGLYYSHDNTISCNSVSDSIYGLSLRSSSGNAIVDNRCQNDSYGVFLMESSLHVVTRNQILNNTYFGVFALLSTGNVIWNNTFIGNNGATSTYDPAHVQAQDVGVGNWWNSSGGMGNYWSDWTLPDVNGDGIVDAPYLISGGSGAKDYFPLTSAPVAPIPEFGAGPLVIIAFLMTSMLTTSSRKRSNR